MEKTSGQGVCEIATASDRRGPGNTRAQVRTKYQFSSLAILPPANHAPGAHTRTPIRSPDQSTRATPRRLAQWILTFARLKEIGLGPIFLLGPVFWKPGALPLYAGPTTGELGYPESGGMGEK